ncbi:MAG: TonB-dependent receptor [Desulfocapsa sp.]|nr:TonB-dependent receptor [Desulfocapsa sp.]
MKKNYSPVLCAQLFVIASAQTILAAEPASQPSMMDEIVVTAGRTEESKASVSSNVTVITEEDIRQSSAHNIGDLLAEQSIGNIRKYPGNLISVGIRGFKTDTHGNDLQAHVLVLLDGRRAGTGNLAKILTENVARIEIIRGPGAVQYGSAGMGGVINVITRRGTNNSLFVEGSGGSYDTASATIGGTALTGGLDFAGAYTYGTTGDYDTGSGETFYNTGINYQSGLSANLGYSFSETNRLGLVFTNSIVDEAGNPGFLSRNDLDDYSDKENYSADLTFEGQCPLTGAKLLARYFFGKDENSWMDPVASNPTGWNMGMLAENKTDQQGAQFQVSGNLGPAAITAGFDWLDYEVENSWSPQTTDYSNPALFLLGKGFFLDDRLAANIGLRYDWYDVEVKEPAGRSADDGHVTPQLGVAWMVTDALKLRAQYGEAFTMPSADQLAADYLSFGARVLGNSDLGPEQSATWEGGIDYRQNGLSAALTYFYTDFEEKIIATYLANGSQTWKNLGDATISGFEAELAYDLGIPFDWDWEVRPYLNLTLLTKYEDDNTGEDLQFINGTNYSAGLVVGNGDGISCRLNVAYSGSQDIIDYEYGYPYQNVTLASNTVTDLTASWRFYENDKVGAFTLRGEVRNLFDEDYAYVKGYPMPGRGLYAGLRWEI